MPWNQWPHDNGPSYLPVRVSLGRSTLNLFLEVSCEHVDFSATFDHEIFLDYRYPMISQYLRIPDPSRVISWGKEEILQLRAMELKHGRVAMLAVLGWFHVAAGYHIVGDYAVGEHLDNNPLVNLTQMPMGGIWQVVFTIMCLEWVTTYVSRSEIWGRRASLYHWTWIRASLCSHVAYDFFKMILTPLNWTHLDPQKWPWSTGPLNHRPTQSRLIFSVPRFPRFLKTHIYSS